VEVGPLPDKVELADGELADDESPSTAIEALCSA
jgi:hypothetical protein